MIMKAPVQPETQPACRFTASHFCIAKSRSCTLPCQFTPANVNAPRPLGHDCCCTHCVGGDVSCKGPLWHSMHTAKRGGMWWHVRQTQLCDEMDTHTWLFHTLVYISEQETSCGRNVRQRQRRHHDRTRVSAHCRAIAHRWVMHPKAVPKQSCRMNASLRLTRSARSSVHCSHLRRSSLGRKGCRRHACQP